MLLTFFPYFLAMYYTFYVATTMLEICKQIPSMNGDAAVDQLEDATDMGSYFFALYDELSNVVPILASTLSFGVNFGFPLISCSSDITSMRIVIYFFVIPCALTNFEFPTATDRDPTVIKELTIYSMLSRISIRAAYYVGQRCNMVHETAISSITGHVAYVLLDFNLVMLPYFFVMDYKTSTYKSERVLKETRLTLGIVMLYISAVVLLLHVFFSGPLRLKRRWGIIGVTITLTASWWVIIFAQFLHIVITKLEEAWCGFTCLTFADLFGEFHAAIRMRKSKELGSGDFQVARFSVTVVSITSVTIGVVTVILVSNGVTYHYSLQYNHMAIGIGSFLCPKQRRHSCGDEPSMQYLLACNHEYGSLVVKGNYYPTCLKDQLNAESKPWGCCVIFQLLLPCQGGKISKEKYTQFPSRKATTIKDKSGMEDDDALLCKVAVNRMLGIHIDTVVLLSRIIEGVAIALAITFISLYICVIAPAGIWDLLNTLTLFTCSGGMLWAYIFVYSMSRRQSPSRRVIMKGNFWIPQVLIKWSNWYAAEAPWENEDKLQLSYPNSNLEDKVVFKGEGNVMSQGAKMDTVAHESPELHGTGQIGSQLDQELVRIPVDPYKR